ncbi:HAD-IA family hydrolase, partial [Pantoea sp. SIMBA_072]
LKIGSCSGYPAVVMEKVVTLAAEKGLEVDHVVATDEVPNGRPHPAQALANVMALGVNDVAACIKVDDTTPGILEGRSAGMWTVALTC